MEKSGLSSKKSIKKEKKASRKSSRKWGVLELKIALQILWGNP